MNRAEEIKEAEDLMDFRARIFPTESESDRLALKAFLSQTTNIQIVDLFNDLRTELIKIDNPQASLSKSEISEIIESEASDEPLMMGCWAYYPWRNTIIHLIEKEDFIRVRTSRNLYKITASERDELADCKVGIIGLSVGNSIAMNIAMERSAGEIRLADRDEMELSNMNRVRSGLFNLGMPKVYIAAREIAELDPFIKVRCYPEGISESNIDDFLTKGGKLNALIEECDSLDIKILSRQKARSARIPVLMETSDRGMIDVERFDLEKDRPILHGLIEHLDIESVAKLKTSEEKVPYLAPMAGIPSMSPRLKASAIEVGRSLLTWPQTASSVMYGSAILAEVYRKIMLGEFRASGRFIADPWTAIIGKVEVESSTRIQNGKDLSLTLDTMMAGLQSAGLDDIKPIPSKDYRAITEAGRLAPSGGNSQPWKFLYSGGRLHVFIDKASSLSFMDFQHSASYISIGAVIENCSIMAASLGYKTRVITHPDNEALIASLEFTSGNAGGLLAASIFNRHTDRKKGLGNTLPDAFRQELKEAALRFDGIDSHYFTSGEDFERLSDVISTGDFLRLINPTAHADFTESELRWTREDALGSSDGIYTADLNLSARDEVALEMIKDGRVTEFLRRNRLGLALRYISRPLVMSASMMVVVLGKGSERSDFLNAGRLMERWWLMCTKAGIGFQVMNVPNAFLLRLKSSDHASLIGEELDETRRIADIMKGMIPDYSEKTDYFIARIFNTDVGKPLSARKPLDNILYAQ